MIRARAGSGRSGLGLVERGAEGVVRRSHEANETCPLNAEHALGTTTQPGSSGLKNIFRGDLLVT